MKALTPLAAVVLASPPLLAQDVCEGNGLGNTYTEVSPATIGGVYTIDQGSPDLPFGLSIVSISNGFGPTVHPILGLVCLDVFSPAYTVFAAPLDGTGNLHLAFGVPNDPSLVAFPPLYGAPANVNGTTIETGKTVPVYFELPSEYRGTSGVMAQTRSMHKATALGQDPRDNRIQVFISGGGTGSIITLGSVNSTEIFQPLDRTFFAGPDMAVDRAEHTATLLQDGRVLITGGADGGGVVTASCEIYDHTTGTISFTTAMSTPRIGHTATLLQDGRVLVTGGLSNYVNAATQFAAVLNTAQDTGEVYDPATGLWAPVANAMGSKRSGHGAVLLDDGRVFLIAGTRGGTSTGFGTDVPLFTSTCDHYDPATNTFVPSTAIPSARSFFGASLLGNGDVLVTGGTIAGGGFGEAIASSSCYRWDGAAWSITDNLNQSAAFHRQVTLDDGNAFVTGGLIGDLTILQGTEFAGVHDGFLYTQGVDLGSNSFLGTAGSPRGEHTATKLWDGSVLLLGGYHGTAPFGAATIYDDGFIYTP